jgi:hypothetical protein
VNLIIINISIVGKTLTAETIAEKLHRPLYTISVGELGIIPEELEGSLKSFLDQAREWDAIVLIDEGTTIY